MGIGTDKLGESYIQNLTTKKTTFIGKVDIKDMQYEINENKDKVLYKLTFPRELNITLDNYEINKGKMQEYLKKAQTYSVTSDSITIEEAIYLRTIGFIIYHMRKSKSKRIQKKWDKKYGYRAINYNVKSDEIKIYF